MTTPSPETTIVIRAFNEEKWLPAVFSALDRQNYRDFEVLLVDSGSVDATRDIAIANGARIVRLRSEDFTFGHSLNLGVTEARGSLIAILSAHAIPSDEFWLDKLVSPLRDPENAMVYGGQRGHPTSKFSEARDFERIFPDHAYGVDIESPFANNANSAVRRDHWQEHHFDEGLPGLEDIEWAKHWLNLGKRVLYEPAACVIHVHSESWKQVRRRYHREGMAARWVGIRILRNIPGEILRELFWCAHDLWLAAACGQLASTAGQIMRFRYEKTVGTVYGIADSRGMSNPARRAELFSRQEYSALVVRGPKRVQLEERTVPKLRPADVLIRVSHIGIRPTDIDLVDGKSSDHRKAPMEYPFIPCGEASGTVVALGPRVIGLEEGDRVVVETIQGCGECIACNSGEAIRCSTRRELGASGQDGTSAEYFITPAKYAHKLPDTVSFSTAVMTGTLASILKGLRRLGNLDTSTPFAVIGSSAMAHLVTTTLKSRGLEVTTYPTEEYGLSSSVAASTAQSGPTRSNTCYIDVTGRRETIQAVLESAPHGSTLLALGSSSSAHPISLETLVLNDKSIIGSDGSSTRDFSDALSTLPTLDLATLPRLVFPLAEFERAFTTARANTATKVILTCEAHSQ